MKKVLQIISLILIFTLVLQIAPMSALAAHLDEVEAEQVKTTYSTNVSQEEATPVIVGEDNSREKSSNIKYFKMSDGTTKVATYNQAVQYQDANGVWKDIDNTLISSSEEDSTDDDFKYDGYENKSNRFKIKFAKNSKQSKLMSLKLDDYALSFSLLNKSKSIFSSKMKEKDKPQKISDLDLQNTTQTVYYEDIISNTDIEYTISGESIKENIIVKNEQDEYVYSFETKTKNLTLSLDNDGNIVAVDSSTGNLVFELPKPFMFDSNGKFSANVNYTLVAQNKNKYQITITADSDWINSEERVLPVTIDPGVQTKQSRSSIDSVHVISGNPDKKCYSDPMIMVGKDSTSSIGKAHGLLKFECPSLNRGDVVIDAQLSACQVAGSAYSTVTTPDTAIEVHAVTQSWNKTEVNWENKPNYESEVADFEILKASECNSEVKVRTWNVTSIVKRWYDGTLTNNGFLLRSSNENLSSYNDSCIYIWLYGEKYSQNEGYPILTITYRSNKGLESYWSYTSFNVGEAGTAHVCDFSGNLVFTHNDASTYGSRATASVSHVYNGYMAPENFASYMPYRGHGWMMSCQQQLLSSSKFGLTGESQTQYPYVYIDGDGTDHYFYKKTDGSIVDEDGMGLTLTVPKTNNTQYYKITDEKDNIIWFNNNGAISQTSDANGNWVKYNYDSNTKLKTIEDCSGRKLTFSGTGDDWAVKKVTDAAGRTTTFNWSNGFLSNIVEPDGDTTVFTYEGQAENTNDRTMTSVTAPDGYKLEFEYTSEASGKRISKVVEKSATSTGQTVGFSYPEYGTTVIHTSGKDGIYGNTDDIFTTVRFDSAGRTVSSEATCNGKSLGATSAEYTASKANSSASNIKQLNRVSKSLASGQFVRNYLTDGSSDTSGSWTSLQWNGNATFAAYPTTTGQLYGRWSYYINSQTIENNSGARAYQTLTTGKFKDNTTYTFSAWIKTENVTPLVEDQYGASIFATYWDADNVAHDTHTEFITGTTDTAINNGWRRIAVTFSVPAGAKQIRCNLIVRGATGKAWYDGMQLEEGSVPNNFNLINNSSLETYTQQSNGSYLPDNWTGTNTDTADTYNSSSSFVKDSSKSFKFATDPTVTKEIRQDINLGGATAQNLDDSYIISGWVYANPVEGSNEGNKISIGVKVMYSDGTSYLRWFDANSSVKGWQYIIGAFTLRDGNNKTAEKTPTQIRIYLSNYRQSNSTYFDNIMLVRDEAPSYTYDSDGNLITVQENAQQNSTMEYSNSDLTKSYDAKGYNYSYQYDNKHNMTQATSQGGTKYCYTYDASGNPTSLRIKTTDSAIIATDVEYSSNGQFVTKTVDQDGINELYEYEDTTGYLKKYTDKKGNETVYTYNSNADLLTSVSQTLDNGQTISANYTYNDSDSIQKITYNGFEYTFSYDSFGNRTQTKMGSNVLSTNTYGANNGNLNCVTYGNGDYIDYTYDDYGNVISQSSNGQPRFNWTYDSSGNIYSHEDLANSQKIMYNYDSTGRLIRQTEKNTADNTNGYTYEYGYDLNNNVNKLSTQVGGASFTESYSYGEDNLPETYTSGTGKTTTYSYDNILRRTQTTINTTNPINIKYTYLVSDRNEGDSQTYRTTKVGWEQIGDLIYKYEYDDNGNITKISRKKDVEGSTYTDLQQFHYDELNQLVRCDDRPYGYTFVYEYDDCGNMLSNTYYPLTWGSLDGVEPLISSQEEYSDTFLGQLTAINTNHWTGGDQIVYDEIGNPVHYRGIDLTWENGRELTSAIGSGIYAEYTYDSNGLRTSKKLDDYFVHTYKYINGKVCYEEYEDKKFWFFYDADGNPSHFRYFHDENEYDDYYYGCNWRGDVIAIFDSEGNLAGSYDYDAWGNAISLNDADGNFTNDSTHITHINPIRYRGYYCDTETGFYYLNSRYYDPMNHRFLNADDTAVLDEDYESMAQYNLYAYCWNNPVNMSDYTGESPANIIGGIVGGISGAALGYLLANALGLSGWKKVALITAATVGGAVLGAFLGPYVAKLGGKVAARLGLKVVTKQTIKMSSGRLWKASAKHIFSKKHISDGIMRLGGSQKTIFNKLYKVVKSYLPKAANGSNQIHTTINGVKTTIRFYVSNGQVQNIDAFTGWATRVIGRLL